MFFSLFLWLVGSFRITAENPTVLANCLVGADFSCYRMQVKGQTASFSVLSFAKKKALRHLRAAGLAPVSVIFCGLPAKLAALKGRWGLLLGLAAMIALPLFSGRFLWQIDIVGNSRLSDGEVLAMLAEEGVFEGVYVGDLDPRTVANRCVMHNESLAWMALNLSGNRMEVDVVEYDGKGETAAPLLPSNVSAKKSGVIRRVELVSGVAEVKEGQVVNEGALLISGVNLLRNGQYIYQPAAGRVFAETLNEITITEPLTVSEKSYTGEVISEKTLIFFTKSKKVKKYSGNLPANCDRIEKKERIMLFGRIPLPLWVKTVEYRPFVFTERKRSEAEASEAARAALGEALARGELLSCKISVSVDGDKVTLYALYRIVEDIAENRPLVE